MNNKELVFINQNAGYLMIDIINANSGSKQVSLITGRLNQRNIPLNDSVKIDKIIPYNRSSATKRIFTWVWSFIQIWWRIKTRYRKADLFIVTNPPFAIFLPLFCNNPFSILVFDVYPDALVAFNFFKKGAFTTRLWEKANRNVFAKASHIFTVSKGMKKALSQYVAEEKITMVPIWTDSSFLKPMLKSENTFVQQQQWQDKFLVVYSGNLGRSHDIEVMVEIAAKIKDNTIQFVIIGEGDKQQSIKLLIEKYQLQNCTLLPWQEANMLPYTLSAADIAVVTIGKEASALSIPSKTFNLLSTGTPLLCVASSEADLAELVNQYQVGKCFDATAIDEMIAFIHHVKSDKHYQSQLRQNALTASKDFSPENAFTFAQL